MNNKTFIKLILTHKKSLFFMFKFIFIVIFLLIWVSFLTIEELFSSLFVVFLFIIIIFSIVNNYLNFLLFFIYQRRLFLKEIQFSYDKCIVEVFESSYKMSILMKNQDVTIEKPSYKIECNFILTKDYFILFCKTSYFFSLFKREIPPLFIRFDDNSSSFLKINKKRVVNFSETYYEYNNLILLLPNNIKDLKRINIIDFKNITQELHSLSNN